MAQESYDNCANALELCPSQNYTLNNIGATSTVCSNCEDDFNFCFSGGNTIWLKFTTNDVGGDMTANFSNLNFENNPGQGNTLQALILETVNPCIASSYNLISNCESSATTNFTLSASNLSPTTTYYIVVSGSMGANANAEATFNLNLSGEGVEIDSQFHIWTEETTMCTGNPITICAFPKNCPDQSVFNWYLNGEFYSSTLDTLVVFPSLSDNDVVTAKVSCNALCDDTITSNSISFTVLDFVVDAGEDFYITQGETVQLNGYTNGGTISWEPYIGMSDPTVPNPIVSPEETTTYFMTVSNGTCTITDEVTVYVESELIIPNTFSPNGDGINDTWEILGIEAFPDCGIQVFTRWGQVVFQTTGYSQDKRWDGTSKNGNKLEAGVYYYVINLRDDKFDAPLKGSITIVR